MKTKTNNMAKDKCIVCSIETAYDETTHIDMRIGYVEGAGQLCKSCYNATYSRKLLAIPIYLITDTPNDQELGAKIRKFYYDNRD
jgi:hypothetical protein